MTIPSHARGRAAAWSVLVPLLLTPPLLLSHSAGTAAGSTAAPGPRLQDTKTGGQTRTRKTKDNLEGPINVSIPGRANGDRSVALGNGAKTVQAARDSVALGPGAQVLGVGADAAVVVGLDATVPTGNDADNAVAIGVGAGSGGIDKNSIVIGTQEPALGQRTAADGIAVGRNAFAGRSCVSLGLDAGGRGMDSVTVGTGARSINNRAVVIGAGAGSIDGNDSVILGTAAQASDHSIAIGLDSNAVGSSNIAIGREAVCDRHNCVVVGYGATNNGEEEVIAIGRLAGDGGAEKYSVCIGSNSVAGADRSTVIGDNASSSGQRSVALGANATVSDHDTARIGGPGVGTHLERKVLFTSPTQNESHAVCAGTAFTLPASRPGLTYTFVSTGATLTITGGSIRIYDKAGGTAVGSGLGASVTLVDIGGTWFATSVVGTWCVN